ncbi:MAG: NitT/TauT family transport system ATP-binding protein [Thermoleophilaceae bacterium]|nr:NitT/TauT family transport system ATP-binding protein [Thermoleophilaceae bacterium]
MAKIVRNLRRRGAAPSESHELVVPIQIDGVSKSYETREGEVRAVEDFSLDCRPGEFVSIVGPSGCGKSTMLLMVAGLIPATSGTVTIGETVVNRPYTDLGFVFQDSVLLDWRRTMGNVLLQAELRGLDKNAYRPRAQELIDLVGLSGFEDRYPFELSGGMRQRVSICRALLHDPALLLMDEPFGALDALTRDQLNLDLQEIWLTSQKTVLFVTHGITEAVFLSDRVVVMSPRPGRIEEVLDIALPRPRHLSVRETPEFGKYTSDIRRIFGRLGVLREEHGPAGGQAALSHQEAHAS